MEKPEPNTTIEVPGGTVEYKVCSCCKDDSKHKHRFFLRDESGQVVCMTGNWEALVERQGW